MHALSHHRQPAHTHSVSSWCLRQVNPIFPQREGFALSVSAPGRAEERREKRKEGKRAIYLKKWSTNIWKMFVHPSRPHLSVAIPPCLFTSDPSELLSRKVYLMSHPHQCMAMYVLYTRVYGQNICICAETCIILVWRRLFFMVWARANTIQ